MNSDHTSKSRGEQSGGQGQQMPGASKSSAAKGTSDTGEACSLSGKGSKGQVPTYGREDGDLKRQVSQAHNYDVSGSAGGAQGDLRDTTAARGIDKTKAGYGDESGTKYQGSSDSGGGSQGDETSGIASAVREGESRASRGGSRRDESGSSGRQSDDSARQTGDEQGESRSRGARPGAGSNPNRQGSHRSQNGGSSEGGPRGKN